MNHKSLNNMDLLSEDSPNREGIQRKGKRSNSHHKRSRNDPPFIADMFTKDLKAGKLPFNENNERIARFGKGFSNMLQMAAPPMSSR